MIGRGYFETVKGKRLNSHCPYDETQLRQSSTGSHAICPCCWSYFPLKQVEAQKDPDQ